MIKGALQSFFCRKATLSIVYIFCYCRYLTCAPRHACVFQCAEVLILMDTACKIQPNESPWSPLLKVAFRVKNDCRVPLNKSGNMYMYANDTTLYDWFAHSGKTKLIFQNLVIFTICFAKERTYNFTK